MENWLKICLILCLYGFFKELRPSEPFLTEYLLGPQHNLTQEQVYYEIYPVWTYSYLSLLIGVFLLTDLVRYKPVIILEGVSYVSTWCLLLWARGVHWMQLMEFSYGITTSTEVAYYTYIYAQVDSRHYQKVTSYTRSALLAGKFLSGVSGQILYSTGVLDYHSLNYVSLGCLSVALIISIFLPPVQTSIYFHRKELQPVIQDQSTPAIGESQAIKRLSQISLNSATSKVSNEGVNLETVKKAIDILWKEFIDGYSNSTLLKWSIWWSFATCIYLQVLNYIQPLWETLTPFHETELIYNGAVEAASTFLGALSAFGVGYFHLNWRIFGEMTLGLISLVDAVLLIMMGMTNNIVVAYVNYIAFRVSYEILITVACCQVAKELKAESYGLIFGFNMFMALLIQCILTVIVIEWLQILPGLQFVIYGCYFGLLAFVFLTISTFSLSSLGCKGIQREGCWESKLEHPVENDSLEVIPISV